MTRRTLLYLGGLLALALSTGGFFWYQHYQAVKNAEPVKIYKATQPRQVSETPSLQGEGSVPVQHAETSEAGHWHGDEWHAEPHAEPAAPDEALEVNESPIMNATEAPNPETPWYEVLHNELEAKLAHQQHQLREHRAEVLATRAASDALDAKLHLLSPEEFHRETNKIVQRKTELDRRAKALHDQLMQIQADHFRKLREGLAQEGGTQ